MIKFKDFQNLGSKPKDGSERMGRVVYHFDTEDDQARETIKLLTEAKPSVDLGKGRSIVHHTAHIPDGQAHLHFMVKGRKVAAVNIDGTAHDRSHGIKLQRWALDGAAKHFPNFKMPSNGLIESLFPSRGYDLLTESTADTILLLKANRVIAEVAIINDRG